MIAICPNPFRDEGLKITKAAQQILAAEGFETVICPVFAEDNPEIVPSDIETRELGDIAAGCSLIIVVGGDGTILAVARQLDYSSIPLLGINLGTKGFMSSIEPENLGLIVKAARGEMELSRRMMLDVKLMRQGEELYADCALNDAVIHGYGDCVNLTAWCEGDKITSFSGDGIIAATPTGSTGYSMSAGGPIVEPDATNIIISPICAHVLGSRPFVLDSRRTIKIETERLHGRRAYLSIDGNNVMDLENGDILVISRAERYTLMADLGLKSFYEIAYEKLT